MTKLRVSIVVLLCLAAGPVAAGDDNIVAHKPVRPQQFAIIFNYGYAGDHFPADPAAFERVVRAARAAHFNTILCKWEDWRGEICKRHGMQIFVDLLVAEHHVYRSPEQSRALCERLRGNPVVYGYHLWSDNIGETYPGRSRDVRNVHAWDPTHPAYVGTYRMSRVSRVDDLDLLGYYDFHWKRGGHWPHLLRAWEVARQKDARLLRYCDASPGQVGVGNVNRVGWTIATSVAFGLKGYLFHYGGGVIDRDTGELDTLGVDLQRVNAELAPLGPELLRLDNPTAVFSTPVTRTNKDRPIDTPAPVLPELPGLAENHWYQVLAGEVVMGLFDDADGGSVVVFASHNAYCDQAVRLRLAEPRTASRFDPRTSKWERLMMRDSLLEFTVPAWAPVMIRFEPR
jgi:hypothetical protein